MPKGCWCKANVCSFKSELAAASMHKKTTLCSSNSRILAATASGRRHGRQSAGVVVSALAVIAARGVGAVRPI